MNATAQILDGKALAQKLKEDLAKEVVRLKKDFGAVPRLVNIMVGNNASAVSYASSQKRIADDIGLQYEQQTLPADITQQKLLDVIKKLNADKNVHGIMIYKPLPKGIDFKVLTNSIAPAKDLEGISVTNMGKMILGEPHIVPCTSAAVMELIRSAGINLRGKEAVIVGRSEIVGRPLILLLLAQNATVTVCHSGTGEHELIGHVSRAEVLVVAVGKPAFIKGDWIKTGAIVVDVGINKVGEKFVGDIEFEKASQRAAFITPVPSGVGPMTAVMLMRSGIEAFKIQQEAKH